MQAVLNKDTKEVLGFPDGMSSDAIDAAIHSDTTGRPVADVNPTFYDTTVRPAMEQAKVTGNYDLVYKARAQELAQDPFVNAVKSGLSFGFLKDNSAQGQQARASAPVETFVGDLVGQTAAILATAGVGEAVFGVSKVAQGLGLAARGATPLAIRAATVGSGEILPEAAGKVISDTVSSAASASMVGAMYQGITASVDQGKQITDGTRIAPNLVKIGTEAFKGLGWGVYGVGGGFAKTALGLSTGTAAVAGAAYAVSKSEGASEQDSLLNSLVMGIFHASTHTNFNLGERKQVVSDLQDTLASYTKAKNGMTEVNNVHQLVGDEFVKKNAENILQEKQVPFDSETGAIDKIVQSSDDTKELIRRVSDQVLLPQSPDQATALPEFKNTEEAAAFGATNKDSPELVKSLKDTYDANVLKIQDIQKQSDEAVKAGDIKLSDQLDSQGFVMAQKNQLYREAYESATKTGGFKGDQVQPIEGAGEMKTRGLSKGVETKAVENRLTQGFGDLPEYKSIDMKDQASKAMDILNKDYEQAKRIAMGEEAPPKDVIPESVFVAVENKAIKEGDVNTLRDLATKSRLSAEATTMGQRLRTLAERDSESPVGAIKDVQATRAKASKAKTSDKETSQSVKEIKSEIKKASPKIEDWNSFIDSLEC